MRVLRTSVHGEEGKRRSHKPVRWSGDDGKDERRSLGVDAGPALRRLAPRRG